MSKALSMDLRVRVLAAVAQPCRATRQMASDRHRNAGCTLLYLPPYSPDFNYDAA
ncbi:hypothetical protein RWA02_32590 (plasmid) [Sinorhizobium meliloti]